jgi:hypothetical protein
LSAVVSASPHHANPENVSRQVERLSVNGFGKKIYYKFSASRLNFIIPALTSFISCDFFYFFRRLFEEDMPTFAFAVS